MKKIIFILSLGILFFSQICNAQSYRENKLRYNASNYYSMPDDPYNPALCGVASFFLPGLGQIIAGETARGLAFFGGSTLSAVAVIGGFIVQFSDVANSHSYDVYSFGNKRPSYRGAVMIAAGLVSITVINIWSIVDAINVAKVNSMYSRDLRKKESVGFTVSTYLDAVAYQHTGNLPIGLSFNLRF